MNSYIRYLCILLVALSACACGGRQQKEYVYDYDVYEVEVRSFLWMRAEPSKKGKRLGRLENGTQVRVYDIENGWGRLMVDGQSCYVAADYLVLRAKLKKEVQAVEPVVAEPVAEEHVSDALVSDALVSDVPVSDVPVSDVPVAPDGGAQASESHFSIVFCDSAGVLDESDRLIISRAAEESGLKWHVLTVAEISRDKIADYASERLDEVVDEATSGQSWWKKRTGQSADSVVVMCFDASDRMLSIESRHAALRYLELSYPHDLFAAQSGVRSGQTPGQAMEGMAKLLVESKNRYDAGSLFLSIGVKSASFVDYLCDDLIAKNILPRDSFFHKWVLGPVFAIPFSIANGMLLATGSLYGVLLLCMLLYAALALWRTELSMRYAKHKRSAYIVWLFWVWLAKTVVWLTLTSMVVYMMPQLENIVVMERYGYSPAAIERIASLYADGAVFSGWIVGIMFVAGVLIKLCMNVEYTVYSMCAPHVQRRIYAANRESVGIDLITDERNNYDIERYDASPRPYSDLAANFFIYRFVKLVFPAVLTMLVLNDTLLMYATLYLWAYAAADVGVMVQMYAAGRRHNLYERA
ncbi:MAG: SH3 domain-containing protein [Muribaculaceae bacterium]|nr:SH3 domain-containing protein [Muribaculaceae bacterium]